MEKINIFKMLIKYIWENIIIIFLFALFSVVFLVVFSLYNLEVEAIIYSTGICSVIGIIVFIICFLKFYFKHKKLIDIHNNILLIDEAMIDTNRLLEEDYQDIIKVLRDINTEDYTNYQSKQTESIEYYTTWAHQIKTPIAVMQMILQSEDTLEHKELLFELFRIEQYVEMVLSYLRLDSTTSDFLFKEYELDTIIKGCIRKYASQFIRKRIKLEYEGTDSFVLTDEKWLSFIIEQLLSNCIKYTDKGRVTIKVNDNIVSISDTGIGIASEDLPRVFEKGFTGYNGRANKKSTGLGLYLCKKTADKLSHKIYAESQVGVGTTVFIDLNTINLEIE